MANYQPRSWTSTAMVTIVIAAATACADWITFTWRRTTTWITEIVAVAAGALPRLTHQWPDVGSLQVDLVRARAFVLRILQRDAPRMTPGWRLCPSI